MPNLKIRKFDPAQIKPYRMIIFVGKKGSGKSTLMKDIFYHLRHRYDMVVALAGTQPAADMFREFIPEALVYDKIDISVAEKLVQYSRIMVAKKNPRNVLLLMDDCLGYTGTKDKNPLEHAVFREIAFNQRHLNLTFAVSLQYCMSIKPNLRTQIDYAFVFQDTNRNNRHKLWEYFFGMFEDLDSFTKTLQKCTNNYGCLVLDNVKNTGNFEDNLYYYTASQDTPAYKLGKDSFWFLSQYYATSPDPYGGALFDELVRHLDVTKRQNTKDSRQDRLIVEKV
jgi:energy-coupling factor transporter ATP-binding protein EcfA2